MSAGSVHAIAIFYEVVALVMSSTAR